MVLINNSGKVSHWSLSVPIILFSLAIIEGICSATPCNDTLSLSDSTAVTLGFLLLAAMFYPSCNVLSKWEDEETKKQWCKNPRTLSEYYY